MTKRVDPDEAARHELSDKGSVAIAIVSCVPVSPKTVPEKDLCIEFDCRLPSDLWAIIWPWRRAIELCKRDGQWHLTLRPSWAAAVEQAYDNLIQRVEGERP